jgi:integrase
MPRKARELSPLEVRRLVEPGRWSVGGVDGLALQVTASGARSWVLRLSLAGRQREMGLGSFPSVTLAEAREKARANRALVQSGDDPIARRTAAISAAAAERSRQQTFAKTAEAYIAQHEATWKSAKHAAQWAATLEKYAIPVLGALHVRDITPAHVIRAIEPIWATKTETASRVRSRIELVLDYAGARGLREGPNPARWRGNLDAALPKASKVAKVEHHAAVPVAEAPAFMHSLGKQQGVGARALEFVILTAARSGEVRGATWGEIDLDAGLWTVPAQRMKGGREHRVPLSPTALDLLRSVRPEQPKADAIIFPGTKGPLSDMSLTAVMRRMKVAATVHGFRSTFRDWVSECTTFASEVAEAALAHALGDKVEAAYRRGDLLSKRRELMEAWAQYCTVGPRAAQRKERPAENH